MFLIGFTPSIKGNSMVTVALSQEKSSLPSTKNGPTMCPLIKLIYIYILYACGHVTQTTIYMAFPWLHWPRLVSSRQELVGIGIAHASSATSDDHASTDRLGVHGNGRNLQQLVCLHQSPTRSQFSWDLWAVNCYNPCLSPTLPTWSNIYMFLTFTACNLSTPHFRQLVLAHLLAPCLLKSTICCLSRAIRDPRWSPP